MQAPGEDRRLIYGAGSINSAPDFLKEYGSSRPLLVTSADFASSSLYLVLKRSFDSSFVEFREITYGSPLPEIEHMAETYRNKNCDSVVSVGDNSVISSAKLLKYYYAYDTHHLSVPVVPSMAPFSNWASYSLGDEVKYVADSVPEPDGIILDSSEKNRDAFRWAISGLSVMESAFFRLGSNEISDGTYDLLLSSVENLLVNLPGDNEEAKTKCLLAPWYAKDEGYSVLGDNATQMRDYLAMKLGIGSELADALLLPLSAYECAKSHPERTAMFAQRLGFRGEDPFQLSEKSFDLISGLIRKLDLIAALNYNGVTEMSLVPVLRDLQIDEQAIVMTTASFF